MSGKTTKLPDAGDDKARQFGAWLAYAEPGERCAYYEGQGFSLCGPDTPLGELREMVLACAGYAMQPYPARKAKRTGCRGVARDAVLIETHAPLVLLIQGRRRLPLLGFTYIAVRTRVPLPPLLPYRLPILHGLAGATLE